MAGVFVRMIASLAPAVRALKRLLRRCDQQGCWRFGCPCWDVDMKSLVTRAFWRKCSYHIDLEMRAEVERQRHDPKIIIPGDRVRALSCAKPEECAKHGSHEGTLTSTTFSSEFSERACKNPMEPLQPKRPGDLIFHIDSDEGVHYHALQILKIAGGSNEERAKRHQHCHHQTQGRR